MPRDAVSPCERNDSKPPPRRSARIQQQQKATIQAPANPAQCGRTSGKSRASSQGTAKRKRKRDVQGEEACDVQVAKRRSSRSSNTITSHEDEATKPYKRDVRFAGGEPLEPISTDLPDVEQAERAAAAATTADFLTNRPENAQYVDADVRTVHCPLEAVAKIAPTRTRDSKGRVLLQYPTRYILAFKMEVLALHEYFKAIGRDYRSVAGTMLFFLIQVQDLLSIRHGHGLYETTVMGKTVWTIVMSESDRPETLPYPTARIRIFQDIMESDAPPSVFDYRPTARRIKESRSR